MRVRVLIPLLAVLLARQPARAGEQPSPDPESVLRKAVAVQGELKPGEIHDIYLKFRGPVTEQDQRATIEREYWYRAKDRAFRIKTAPVSRVQETSERGILGSDYWEKSKGKARTLQPGNRDDRGVMRQIVKDREDFERMLRLLLLTRLTDGQSKLSFASNDPVRLRNDFPPESKAMLRDRDKRTYFALSVERRKREEPRLVLYIDREDYTVRKVEQFFTDDPRRIEWIYYFGPFKRQSDTGLTLPQYFAVHSGLPTDRESQEKTSVAHGFLSVRLNTGLGDAEFAPG